MLTTTADFLNHFSLFIGVAMGMCLLGVLFLLQKWAEQGEDHA